MDAGVAMLLLGLLGWCAIVAWSLSKRAPAAPGTPQPARIELSDDTVLVVSTEHPMTNEAMQDLSANLSAVLMHKRRPLVLVVPPGMKVEAVLRCPNKITPADAGNNDGGRS